MQYVSGSRKCLTFAIGQRGDSASLFGLDTAISFLQEGSDDEFSMVLASDRWLQPFSRRIDNFTIRGDGAAGVLVTQAAAAGFEVLGLSHSTNECVGQINDPAALDSSDNRLDALEQSIVGLCKEVCRQNQIEHHELDWIISHNLNQRLTSRVVKGLNMRSAQVYDDGAGKWGCFTCSDVFASMHDWQEVHGADSALIVAWTASHEGYASAGLFRYVPDQ